MENRGTIEPGIELLGGYRVLGFAGEGSWSYVYKAKHPTLSRFVAIKQLKPELVENKDALQRFLREAHIVSQLTHPNVVTIYDVGRDEETGLYCIITEFAEKGSLAHRLKEYHGGLPVDEVLYIAMGICNGLSAVHQKEIVHLDIKPSNVLLCDVGPGRDVPKLSDFGIAKTPDTEGTGTFKSSGPFGSFHYASPEQWQLDKGVEVDHRSDIYSLGVLIYQLLTGQVPFPGQRAEVSLAHIFELPAPPSELRSDIPEALEQIVLRALRKVCEERYQSAVDMLAALRAVEDVSIRRQRRARAGELVERGIEDAQSGDWGAAAERFTEADLLDPGNEKVQRELKSAHDQQKLKRLYDQSVECLEKKDWEGVERFLLPIIGYDPGYAGGAAQDLLELATRRRDLTVKYHTAMGHFRQKEWAQAVVGLEVVTAEDPDYEDAADWLADARRCKDLFDRARQHARRGEWESVVGIYREISHLGLPDVDVTEELNQAVQEWDEAATGRQLSEWYAEGVAGQKAGHLRQARRSFERIDGIRPDYSDVKQRLEEIDKEIKLRPLFEQASSCEAAHDWKGASEAYLEILQVDRYNPKATSRLARVNRCAAGGYWGALVSVLVRAQVWLDKRDSRVKAVLRALFFIVVVGFCIGALAAVRGLVPPIPATTPTSTSMAPVTVVTPTPTPTPRSTPTPTLLSPVTLEEPEDSACLGCESPVTLRWSCPYALQEGEYYQLSVKGQTASYYSLFYPVEDRFTLPALSSGKYNWAVTVVRSTDADKYVEVSEESKWRSFKIVPSPIVRSISPTYTVQGTSATAVVSGENLTHSLAFTIGVPLTATFVNSSTITTTVPASLEVGEHPVIVMDLLGQGDSYASFIVSESTPVMSEPAPLPTQPTSSPWNPATPVPTASSNYNPSRACVVNPCAPAPQLVEPQDGAEARYNSTVHLKWTWDYCLPPEWKFAVRISATDPPHSFRYVDNPGLISCQDGKTIGSFPVGKNDVGKEFITNPGLYYWNIAVVRSLGNDRWERLSAESEIRSFIVGPPGKRDDKCLVPPC